MTEPQDPPTPDDQAATPSGDEEAARLLAVGLSGAGGPPRRQAITLEEMAAHFPDLELLEVLGQGGMGVVYRARQRKLDRLVALKVLPRDLGQDPAFAERFAREARTLAKLQHPHIVGVHEFGERDGLYFLAMEFVDGVTLRQLMRSGEVTPREALAIVPQICEALQFAHDEGVVHRDIKPENILLDRAGRVKVADFGLAKLVERAPDDFTLTGTDQVMGTLHYMAPEQYKTPQEVDHRADIFSLGVVFYEMLTGELPVGRFGKPSEGQDVDARIDEIVMRALERERELRYQRAADVENDVKTVADGRAPAAEANGHGPMGSRVRARHGARRERAAAYLIRPLSRWTLWAIVLIPIAIAAGFVVYGIVYNTTDAHRHPGYHGSKAGLWTGVGLGCLTLVVAVTAIVRTSRMRDRIRGLGLSIGCLIIAMVGTSMALSGVTQEIRNHRHRLEREDRLRDMRRRPSPPLRITGVIGAKARDVEEAIRQTWDSYVEYVKVRDLTLSDLHMGNLYSRDDVSRLGDMPQEEFDEKRQAMELGMGLVGSGSIEKPPHKFVLVEAKLDEWERRATVTARLYSGLRPTHDLHFFMQRDDHGWVFAVEKVKLEER